METLINILIIVLIVGIPFSIYFAIKTIKGYDKMNKEVDLLILQYKIDVEFGKYKDKIRNESRAWEIKMKNDIQDCTIKFFEERMKWLNSIKPEK